MKLSNKPKSKKPFWVTALVISSVIFVVSFGMIIMVACATSAYSTERVHDVNQNFDKKTVTVTIDRFDKRVEIPNPSYNRLSTRNDDSGKDYPIVYLKDGNFSLTTPVPSFIWVILALSIVLGVISFIFIVVSCFKVSEPI